MSKELKKFSRTLSAEGEGVAPLRVRAAASLAPPWFAPPWSVGKVGVDAPSEAWGTLGCVCEHTVVELHRTNRGVAHI